MCCTNVQTPVESNDCHTSRTLSYFWVASFKLGSSEPGSLSRRVGRCYGNMIVCAYRCVFVCNMCVCMCV